MRDAAMSSLLKTWHGALVPEWFDYNGHLNDGYYVVVFSEAIDALMVLIGLDEAGRAQTGHSIFTMESHINYLQELKQGHDIEVRTQILGSDAKRLHICQNMLLAGTDTLLAASEQMLLNVDMSGPRAAPFAPEILAKVQVFTAAHRDLPRPKYAGRKIALPG